MGGHDRGLSHRDFCLPCGRGGCTHKSVLKGTDLQVLYSLCSEDLYHPEKSQPCFQHFEGVEDEVHPDSFCVDRFHIF